MKLSDIIFQSPKYELSVTASTVKLLQASPAGVFSKARPATGAEMTPSKINNAALLFDILLDENTINALYSASTDTLFVEFNTIGGIAEPSIRAVVTAFAKEAYKIQVRNLKPWAYNIPLVVYALAQKYFEETQIEFLEVIEDWKAHGKVEDVNALFRFCDAYYYETKRIYPQDVCIDYAELTDEEIKQMFRSAGDFMPLPIFSKCEECLMPLSVYPTKEGKSEAEKEVEREDAEKFKTCKMGGYMTDYMFELDAQSKIPNLDTLDTFIPTSEFYTMLDLAYYNQTQVFSRMQNPEIGYGVNAIGDDYTNILITGRPGTGKTTVAYALAAALGMPISLVGSSKNSEEDIFQGMTKVSEGGFKFFETAFLERYEHGGIALVDDINRCPAGITALLLDAIEKPFVLMKDGYQEIRRHPMFIFIATMNVGTQGTVDPNEALISRFGCALVLNDPSKDDFINVLEERSKMAREECVKVYNVYTKILDYLKSPRINAEDVALTMTLRQCVGALKLMRIGRPFKDAIRNTMIGVIASKDTQLSEDVYESVVSVLPE